MTGPPDAAKGDCGAGWSSSWEAGLQHQRRWWFPDRRAGVWPTEVRRLRQDVRGVQCRKVWPVILIWKYLNLSKMKITYFVYRVSPSLWRNTDSDSVSIFRTGYFFGIKDWSEVSQKLKFRKNFGFLPCQSIDEIELFLDICYKLAIIMGIFQIYFWSK